jgi:hypothetical protein
MRGIIAGRRLLLQREPHEYCSAGSGRALDSKRATDEADTFLHPQQAQFAARLK